MKKLLSILGVAGATTLSLLLITAPEALGAKDNPHHEEQDGCDHGNSNKPCKPDPQPDHGKECETHGNHGGINEDHCLSPTTTTTQPPTQTTTTTTAPPGTQTTVTTTSSGGSVVNTTTTVLTPGVAGKPVPVTPLGTACVTPDGYPYVTSYPECPKAKPNAGVTTPTSSTEPLAQTGVGSTLIWIALILVISGAASVALSKFIKVGGGE